MCLIPERLIKFATMDRFGVIRGLLRPTLWLELLSSIHEYTYLIVWIYIWDKNSLTASCQWESTVINYILWNPSYINKRSKIPIIIYRCIPTINHVHSPLSIYPISLVYSRPFITIPIVSSIINILLQLIYYVGVHIK